MRHTIIIRSAYSDAAFSEYRLAISRATTLPSLQRQTCKDFDISLRLNQADPLMAERIAAFLSVDVPVRVSYEPPAGRKIQTRMDDDDAVSLDFVATLHNVAKQYRAADVAINFPLGVLFEDGRWCCMTHQSNQFISVVTSQDRLVVFDETHNGMGKIMPVRQVVTRKRFWCWMRHTGVASSHGHWKKKPRASAADKARFGHVSFSELMRLSRKHKRANTRMTDGHLIHAPAGT